MNVNGGFVVNEPGVAQLAERLFKMIWHPFPHFTSIWPSFGGAQCCGAQHGRVLQRTVWTTLGRNIRCLC